MDHLSATKTFQRRQTRLDDTLETMPNVIRYRKAIPEAVEPTRQTVASVGLDLYTPDVRDVEWIIEPGEKLLIDTGIVFEMPVHETNGFRVAGIVKDKSSVAYRQGLCVKAGVIDPDFRGSVKVVLRNETRNRFKLRGNEKIAQIVFVPTWCPIGLVSCEDMDTSTERGTREFGGHAVTLQKPESVAENE